MKDEDAYDQIGNMPILWFESAMDLLKGSAEIRQQVKIETAATGFPFSRSFWPQIMLRAFAIECLLKAHFLRTGKGKLCSGGKYRGVVKNERHDLSLLARGAGFEISADEEHMLDRLSAVAVSAGRYPIFKNATAPNKFRNGERLRIEWGEPKDEIVFAPLRDRLIAPFDSKGVYRRMLKDA
jgi:hypothetical protein